jgi:proline iminopeptidase
MADALFAMTLPFREHRLNVGDGHSLYVEECGHPDGVPVVFLHGGPGSGCSPEQRRFFDPGRFRAILFDQRGCGRSTPLGSLHANTTGHLVADIERIREALGIERWIVFGGSWGSLLALAYARQHPARLCGLVLRGIFLGSPDELQRYAQGADGGAPLAWQSFAAGVPEAERDDLLNAYTRRLLSDQPPIRQTAARQWIDYERALMGEAPLATPPDARQLAKTAVLAHYLAQGCFIDATALLAELADSAPFQRIPAVIVQGSDDPVCPPRTAERLHRACPGADWQLIAGGRHAASAPEMAAACLAALHRLSGR